MVEPGGEMARLRQGLALRERAPLGDPFRQAAVEDGDVALAEGAEGPPDGAPKQADAVIDNDLHAVADAEPTHGAGEGHRIGQHVRQAGRMVGDGVDVEKHRPGDVGFREFRGPSRLAVGRCQDASTMATPGAPMCSASQSVDTR